MNKLLPRGEVGPCRAAVRFCRPSAPSSLPRPLPAGHRVARAATGDFAPNAFIRIAEDSRITLIMRDV